MDVNGTRFHLLLGARDWLPRLDAASAPVDDQLAWDPKSGHVTLRRELFRFPARPVEAPFTPDHRRGAARDRFGHFYWISADQRSIRYRPRDDGASAEFWSVDELVAADEPRPASGAFAACAPPPPPALPHLRGLAVTTRHFLVAGTLAPGGLLVFDLHGGGPPVWLRWPDVIPFAPFDLDAARGGGVWVLDRVMAGVARLWRLDRDLRVVRAGDDIEIAPPPLPDAFRPVDPVPPGECIPRDRTFSAGIALDLASPPVPGDGDPISIVTLPDGSALVMEVDAAAGDTRLYRWTACGWSAGSPPMTDGELLSAPASLATELSILLDQTTTLVGHDAAFVPDPAPETGLVSGTLYVADVAGNQGFAFALSTGVRGTVESALLDITAMPAYFPMRQWAGKALVAGDDREAYYDLRDGWLPLTELPRPRYATRGILDGIVFDGKEPGCVWHRLMLDACIPPGDAVEIESRAADDEDDLVTRPWRREPALRLRPGGPELAWTPSVHGAAPPAGAGTWELLFQDAVGQFVELRLTLRGSGRSSPKLQALRAHYPRFSYLRYLPDVYREDPSSASFTDRFLANIEGLFTELEGRIAGAEVLFDAATAPAEALPWLGEWLGASFDQSWNESRRRLFIRHAAELYRRRGTRRGLLAAVRLALDKCPRSDALFDDDRAPTGDRAPGAAAFDVRLSEAFAEGDRSAAHRFTVLAPIDLSASLERRQQLRASVAAVVERERPAHAAFDVQLYWALFRVGNARVGHDTALGEGSRFSALVLGSGYLGEALLAERHPWAVDDRRVVGRDREGFPPPLG